MLAHFSIFVGMLFGPIALFVFVCFMIELTSYSLAGFKKNELVTEFFQVILVICICMNNIFINIFSNCHEELVKGISQDFGARFYFVIYFYGFNFFFFCVSSFTFIMDLRMFSLNYFCVLQRITCKNLSYWFL